LLPTAAPWIDGVEDADGRAVALGVGDFDGRSLFVGVGDGEAFGVALWDG
jgi:hypothetical protein